MRIALIFLAWVAASLVSADELVPGRMEAAFRAWMQDVGATSGALAVVRHGEVVAEFGIDQTPDAPMEMASLSKAVTAVCVAKLINDGLWQVETTIADVIGHGPDVTIAELLTHSGGFAPDSTQGGANSILPVSRRRAAGLAERVISRGIDEERRGAFAYSNENYAVLGHLIAMATGEPYVTACTQRVLDPIAVPATPSPRTGPMAAWGGWLMTVGHYARFHAAYFGPHGLIGQNPAFWPHVDAGGGANYGMGMVWRRMQGQFNFWHFGANCFPGQLSSGSFAVLWMGNWGAVAAHDAGCLDWAQMAALDSALAQAAFAQ